MILGPPRSGTTLLRRLLDAHPNIACPPETYLLSAAARFLHDEHFSQGLRIGVTAGLGFSGFEETEVHSRLRTMVFSFLDDHAQQQGKARWAEKTAFNVFHLPRIRALFAGHVRFVCIHRHGLDVACSIADLVEKTGGYVEELHGYLQRYPQPLAAFAHAWVDTTAQIQALARDEAVVELRYEDLVRDPEPSLRRLLEALDEPWHDAIVEQALGNSQRVGFGDWKTYGRSAIDSSSIERWKTLPATTINMLAEICNPTLESLGYDPISIPKTTASEDPKAARRRYELGLLVNRMRAKNPST